MSWQEIARWKINTPDGKTEEYVLEKSDSGNFKIKNDFGNVQIEMDQNSAIEFMRRAGDAIEDVISDAMGDINDYDMYD